MTNFERLYEIPLVGTLVSEFLTTDDDASLDCVCKNVYAIHRDTIYPGIRGISPDYLEGSSDTIRTFMNKCNPFVDVIHLNENRHMFCIRTIRKLPNLRELVLAVPLEVSEEGIADSTRQIWDTIHNFINSLTLIPNKLEKLVIVPGYIRVYDGGACHMISDSKAMDHLAIYRSPTHGFSSRVSLYGQALPGYCKLKYLEMPTRMLDWPTEEKLFDLKLIPDLEFKDWDSEGLGAMTVIANLINPV